MDKKHIDDVARELKEIYEEQKPKSDYNKLARAFDKVEDLLDKYLGNPIYQLVMVALNYGEKVGIVKYETGHKKSIEDKCSKITPLSKGQDYKAK